MSTWQTVFQSSNPHQTEIVKDILVNAGLQAVVFNKQDYAYKFGTLEVKVNPDSVIRALKIIEDEISFDHE